MREIKKIIAKNLADLRKMNNLKQTELAEKLQYSDKAISKWEQGETLPDIETLFKICEIYGVTLDYLTQEDNNEEKKKYLQSKKFNSNNQKIITALAVSLVWLISTICYVYSNIFFHHFYWQIFIWSFPASTIILIIFNSIWGKRKYIFALLSVLVWSLLVAMYLQLLNLNLWPIFLLGIPIEIAIILWSQLKINTSEH